MGQQSLDYAVFIAQFIAFASLTQAQITAAYAEALATLSSQITNLTGDPAIDQINAIRMNYATAHLLAILYGENGNPPSGIVGRVDDATQGSVHVHADMGTMGQGAVWWNQTVYGARFWALTEPLRRLSYVPQVRNQTGMIRWRTR